MDTDGGVIFNPLQEGYLDDPYRHLGEIRAADPVHYTVVDQWALFGYDDVFTLLRDPLLSVDDSKAVFDQESIDRFERIAEEEGIVPTKSRSILMIDPPDHTRLRRLVSQAFTPRAIERLRPAIQARVDAALDRIASDGGGDVVAELAFPLPFDVISDMLGMPEADTIKIRDWSEALVKTLDPIVTDDDTRAAMRAGQAMTDHIDQVIEWKRANPDDDILTAMIRAEEDGDRMTTEELNDNVSVLFIAGHETTVNLIGTGIYELLRHPDQLAVWRDDPAVAPNAVDELLRFVSPVQMSRRIATRDLEFGGKSIPTGSFVLAVLASANHDPATWGPDADELDLRREGAGRHVAFGAGAHHCLGASLAKLEGQIAIGTFVARFPDARVVEAAWNGRLNLRGLEHLVVEV